MAYQKADGIWRMMTRTALDKANRTLTVQSDHFSTWAPYAMFWLTSLKDQVQVGKTTEVAIRTTDNFLAVNLEQTEVEIAQEKTINDLKNIKNWKVTGAGTLAPDNKYPSATYTAPGTVPQANPVTVSVEVHNFIPAGAIPGRGATGKLILLKRIRIVEDTWYHGTIAGRNSTLSNTGSSPILMRSIFRAISALPPAL